MQFNSCKDDDAPSDPLFLPQNYQFTKAYGILKSYGIYEAVNSIQIILSNANGNSIEEYTGPGEYLSLYFNVSDVSVSNGQVLLPSGTYTISEYPALPLTIWKSSYSYFTLLDASNNRTSYTLTEGSVTIDGISGKYSINGHLKGYDTEFTFEFEGIITSPSPVITPQMKLTEATVEYSNQ